METSLHMGVSAMLPCPWTDSGFLSMKAQLECVLDPYYQVGSGGQHH